MEYNEILSAALSLSMDERLSLLACLEQSSQNVSVLFLRREELKNKQVGCPHCASRSYYRHGIDKGSQRFKCKSCCRTFTEHTGTWLSGLHKKELADDYLVQMQSSQSLDKISKELHINKKTAFDWRHKILSGLSLDSGVDFEGITESDETFWEHSQKGSRSLNRKGRKRGKSAKEENTRGVSNNKATVIVSKDRKDALTLSLITLGKISKADIAESFQGKQPLKSILCSDGHVSYKGFASDLKLQHVVLRSDLKQFVKNGIYHIQHVNSLHNRLKKWINEQFWGVSTKYLQNYLNWFRMKERLKLSSNKQKEFLEASIQDKQAWVKYRYIDFAYQTLIATQ